MAFTEVARLATTTVRSTAQTATNSYTLPSAPTTGQWLVVALYTNQGIIPTGAVSGANNLVSSVTCGSVSLSVLETSTNTAVHEPTVYASPYVSGMTTTLSVTWQNGIAATTLGVAALIFTGATNAIAAGSALAFRQNGGAFDGAGGATFGATGAEAVVVPGVSSVITWTYSNNAIATAYDNQQQPFIAAFTASSSFNPTTPRQVNGLPASVDSSGNVTSLGQTAGTLVLQTSPSGANTSGKGVIYSPSGNFVFTYTGITTTPSFTLTGCTTTTPYPTTASIPAYCQLMLPINATNTLTEVLPTTSATSTTLGGFQTGNTAAYTGTSTANGSVQVAILSGTTPVRLVLMGGSNTSGAIKQSAYLNLRISGNNNPAGGGFLYTFVPTTRTLTRTSVVTRTLISTAAKIRQFVRSALSTHVRSSLAVKTINTLKASVANTLRIPLVSKTRVLNRKSAASAVNVASVSKTRRFVRSTNVTVTYTIASTRSRTIIRQAIATAVGAVSTVREIFFRSHAGSVTGDFKIAGGRAGIETAQLEGTFETATVIGSQKRTGQN